MMLLVNDFTVYVHNSAREKKNDCNAQQSDSGLPRHGSTQNCPLFWVFFSLLAAPKFAANGVPGPEIDLSHS